VRRSITALIAVIALLGVILLGANLYVQSPSSQQQIKRHLTAAFGMPVDMTRAVFTPWGGLRVDGVRAAGGPGQPVISADIVRVRISWWSLLRGRFVVKTIGLERPTVTLTQNSEGRWMAPLRAVAAATPMEVLDPAAPAPDATATLAPPGAPAGTPPRHTATAPSAPVPILPDVLVPAPNALFPSGFEFFRMRHAELKFIDVKGREVASLEDMNLEGRPAADGGGDFSGKIWFAQATFSQRRARVKKFSSNVRMDGGVLTLPDGLGEIAGGRLQAKFLIRPGESGSPYELSAQISDVSLGRLIQEAGGDPDFASGRLQGNLDLTGLAADPTSQRGGGELRLLDGQFRRGGLLKTFGERSKIEELRRPEFKVATLTYTVEGNDILAAPLLLESANLHFTARGVCQLPALTLDLKARLVLSGPIAKQLPAFIATNFEASTETPGDKFIDFRIGGTVVNPSSDLFDRTLSQPMQSLLGRVLGRNRKPGEPAAATPADPESAATPAPVASPPP
jgi:AsmA-like C-terminal region